MEKQNKTKKKKGQIYMASAVTDFSSIFNITGMHAFKDQFPNKGKNANHSVILLSY